MPYKDPAIKLQRAAEYRASNRVQLAAKQMARDAVKKAADPEVYYAKRRQASLDWRASHRDEEGFKAAVRGRALAHYQKVKDRSEFKKKNQARVKEWRSLNQSQLNASSRKRRAVRYETDIQFKLGVCLRRRLYMAVKGNHRSGMAVSELGCSIAELKAHLERKFTEGMTWDNWSMSGWHIDHIRPLARFDLTDPEQVKAACHFTNLQPLWSAANISKGCALVE